MRIIKDKTKNEIITECPDCKSVFSYIHKDVEWYGVVPGLRCPCCGELNHLDCFKKL